MLRTIGAPFLVALVLSLVLVPICRLVALRFGFIARPREDRWNRRPVALFGGVGIAVAFFGSAAAFGVTRELPVIIAAAAVMFAFGFVDDVLSLKPSTKLIVQIALASALVFSDYRLNWVQSTTLDIVLTLVWVVGLTNAFNLLDNMDGLCAGIAIIASGALMIDLLPGAAGSRGLAEVIYLAILLGATAGFLVYNRHPASVFMGDSGSLLLGFSFAAITVSADHQAPGRSDILSIVAAPVLVLLIPIFDTTLVTLSRWRFGRRASQGGRDHSSHRLVAIGLSERRAVTLLWILAAVGGVLGVVLSYFGQRSSWSIPAAIAFILGMILFAAYLARIRVYEDRDLRVKRGALTPIVVDFMHKRRVAEVLLDFCLITFCYYVAYRLRFEDPNDFLLNFDRFTKSLPIVLAAQMLAFFVVGVYRGVWRHFGMTDAVVVARGVFFGTVAAELFILYVYHFFAYSRTVFIVYAMLLLSAVTLSRASFRLLGDFAQRQRRRAQPDGMRVVVYGAGDKSGLVISELHTRDAGAKILGFIDDDPRKAGIRVMGYPVLGGGSALAVLAKAGAVNRVIICVSHMAPERLNNLEVLCSENGITLLRLTIGLETVVDGEAPPDERASSRIIS
jgi:UDP-GlcNAc:undecaprenyl-phosphate GlcNAc-1-phosphate transferase